MSNPQVVVVGDCLLDVLVRPESALRPDQDVPGQVHVAPGGAAANVAYHLRGQGLTVQLVASLGDDWAGRLLASHLAQQGIAWHGPRQRLQPTGAVAVLIGADAKRSMVSSPGASRVLPPWQEVVPTLAGAQALFLSGYVLQARDGVAWAARLADAAHKQGLEVWLDPVLPWPAEGFAALRGSLDGLVLNADEARTMTGCQTPEQALAQLLREAARVVVKLGSAGAIGAGRDSQLLWQPAPKVQAVDSTGAGDAFDAVLLAHTLRGATLAAALCAAVAAASAKVAHFGAQTTPDGRHMANGQEL